MHRQVPDFLNGLCVRYFGCALAGRRCYLSPLAHRARAARLAISDRRLGLNDSARALTPLRPPMRPSITAAGFLCPFVAARTMAAARTFGSVLLERLGIAKVCHTKTGSSGAIRTHN